MNCHTAFRLLSSQRDHALPREQQTSLEKHVAGCADCRRMWETMSASVSSWSASTASATVPDVERAWQDIRRETRTSPSLLPRAPSLLRWTAPLGAAAALAVIVSVTLHGPSEGGGTQLAQGETAHVDFIEVPENASSMVYVDGQSGWLVVWSVGDPEPAGS